MDFLSVNSRSLEYCKSHLFTEEDAHSVLREVDKSLLAGAVTFVPNFLPKFLITTHLDKVKQGHFPVWLEFFTNMVGAWDGPPLKGTIIVWAQDGFREEYAAFAKRAPLFTFNRLKTDNNSFLIPDPAFMGGKGYHENKAEIDDFESNLPWDEKYPVAFWRGAASNMLGPSQSDETWKQGIRFRLSALSKSLARPDLLSASITSVPKPYLERFPAIEDCGLFSSRVPPTEFFKYKYQIDVDGYYNAWISCFTKLYSQSVVLKAESKYEQWYYPYLREWEHYIPFKEDLNDLVSQIEWARANDTQCKDMALASRRFIQQLDYRDSLYQTARLISEICREKPTARQ